MNINEKYQAWLAYQALEKNLKEELVQMDQAAILDAFYQELAFGTGGLRGILGAGTNRVNIYTIRKATEGFARYLVKTKQTKGIAIAYDNRHFSKLFAREAAKVLAAHKIPSFIYQALRPTPMLSFAVRQLGLSGGIMITASHNPKNYNGYKVYNHTGAQTNLEESALIIDEINKVESLFSIKTIDSELIHDISLDMDQIYLEEVKKIQETQTSKQARIVYSPLHGTGATVIVKLLEETGYQVFPYAPQMISDPNFSNTKSSNPEEKDAYIETITYAKEIDADVIMITDPDADRLGIAVKHQGDYVLLTGNQTAAIELYYILSQRQEKKILQKGYVYSTVVTSGLIETIAKSFGCLFKATLTGFKFIGEQAHLIEGKTPYLFGCEESYGSLISDFVRDKDAVQAVYMLSEITSFLKDQQKTLVDYLNEIYKRYGYHYEYTENYHLKGIEGSKQMTLIMDHFRTQPIEFEKSILWKEDYQRQIRYEHHQEIQLTLPKSNVIKFYFEDDTWLVLRPSGTEPKLKVYFGIKASHEAQAKEKLAQMLEHTNRVIDRLLGRI